MQDVGIGDVLFIILILCVVHGIMYLVNKVKKDKHQEEDPPGN